MWKMYCDCCEKEIKAETTFYKLVLREMKRTSDKYDFGDSSNNKDKSLCEDCAYKIFVLLGEEYWIL